MSLRSSVKLGLQQPDPWQKFISCGSNEIWIFEKLTQNYQRAGSKSTKYMVSARGLVLFKKSVRLENRKLCDSQLYTWITMIFKTLNLNYNTCLNISLLKKEQTLVSLRESYYSFFTNSPAFILYNLFSCISSCWSVILRPT